VAKEALELVKVASLDGAQEARSEISGVTALDDDLAW